MQSVKVNVETKITEVLRERLKDENLSKLARELGMSKSLLADWVASRRLPSMRNLGAVIKLADYLGLTLEQLLTGKQEDRKIISSVSFSEEGRSYRISIERIK